MSGVAAAVYLDAATGEPLALIRDILCLRAVGGAPLFLSYVEQQVRFASLAAECLAS